MAAHCAGCGSSLEPTLEPEYSEEEIAASRAWARRGVVIGLLGVGAVALPALQFFVLPAGTAIRPMGWTMLVFASACFTLLLGLPCALAGIKGGEKGLCALAALLSIAPWPCAMLLLRMAEKFCGIVLSP